MRSLLTGLVRAALLSLVIASIAVPAGGSAGIASVRAASPQPSAGSGDTRSTGEAPGFVGAPLVAVAAVVVLGLAAVLVTVVFVRVTGGPGPGAGSAAPPG